MREIKFKIWDSTNHVMITENNYQEIIDKYMNTSADYIQDEWYPVCNIDIPFWINDLEKDKILLQWTGLKDKNGVDIYEGDILINLATNTTYIIDFHNTRFMLCCIDGIQDFEMHDFLYRIQNQFEILGNIYENKELLGDK